MRITCVEVDLFLFDRHVTGQLFHAQGYLYSVGIIHVHGAIHS